MTCTQIVRIVLIALAGTFSTVLFALDRKAIEHDVTVDGDARSALIYQPTSLSNQDRVPALLVLHGGLGNAENMRETTFLDKLGETERFVTVYPNGTGLRFLKSRKTWNAGRCCGPAVKRKIDDVGYLSQLIDDLVANYHVDPAKVYVTGFSNGAMMAYRLACEIPNKIAAIVPISGTLAVEHCASANSVAVLHIHGETDQNVPVAGGEGSRSVAGVKHRSVKGTFDLLLANRKCDAPEIEQLSNVLKNSYRCSNGADMQLLMVRDSGHVWPEKITTNQTVWGFVREFVKK